MPSPRFPRLSDARDEDFIRELVRRQTAAGAAYIDVCAGRAPENEKNEMLWLIGIVETETDVPLCLDSPIPGCSGN